MKKIAVEQAIDKKLSDGINVQDSLYSAHDIIYRFVSSLITSPSLCCFGNDF